VSPNYFQTLGIAVRRGRGFEEPDTKNEAVVVINDSMARHYWPGRDPFGKRFKTGSKSVQIVGVVKTTRSSYLWDGDEPYFYSAMTVDHKNTPEAHFLVRTAADPGTLVQILPADARSRP